MGSDKLNLVSHAAYSFGAHVLTTFLKRFFTNQFKRSCLPDGPKVGSVGLSPRGDWRMPSDAAVQVWLDDLAREDELD